MINGSNSIMRISAALIGGLALLLLTVSCTPQIMAPLTPPAPVATGASATVDVVATSSPSLATVTSSPGEVSSSEPETTVDIVATSSPSLTVAPSSEPTSTIHLTLWTVEDVSPRAEGEAGRVFGNGLYVFEDTYPNVSVSVVLKNASGKGSVLDYLRTASQVAPSVLPDVVVLDTVDLAQAARTGILVPLDDLVSPSLSDDLLPATRAAGMVDGQLVGIPFEMDVEHLIYNTNKVTSTPISWTDVISSDTTYLFPAKGKNGLVNDAFLIQYLALGGRLQDEEGRSVLDEQPLLSVLDYYRRGVQAGVIPPDVLEIGDSADIWPAYISAQVGMAHVNAHLFLNDRGVLRSTQFTYIPTRDDTPLTISRGRALAIVSRDPDQQVMALRLMEWLMVPDNNAAWSQATAHLPTRYAAFNLFGDSDPYWPFLQRQLEIAVPPPAFPGYDQVGRVLQQAVVEVLSDEVSPEEAAAAAIDAVNP
jgi:ABC-type glycerol-3-phosphate transport system substrate-binding protein